MDIDDLEYQTRQNHEDLERQIRNLRARLDELWETVKEVRTNVNTILNGDDTDEGT